MVPAHPQPCKPLLSSWPLAVSTLSTWYPPFPLSCGAGPPASMDLTGISLVAACGPSGEIHFQAPSL